MTFEKGIPGLIDHFFNLIYPRLCFSCNEMLIASENAICVQCKLDLPVLDNPVVIERIKNKLNDINPQYLSCFLYYRKGNITQQLLHSFKYEGYEILGLHLGRWFGEFLASTIEISDIDLMIPIPLHKSKLRKRGFNQSAVIAKGIADITGLSYSETAMERVRKNKSQTKKTRFKRMMDVREIFEIKEPSLIKGKHILLIDDVVTTGSTISACANKVLLAGAKRISIASLAAAQ